MRRSSPCASLATVALLAVSVGACAMLETRETKLQAVKTVGVVSAVGDEIEFCTDGADRTEHRQSEFSNRILEP